MLSRFSLPLSSSLSPSLFCNSCSSNKSHKLPFSISTLSTNRPLEILFSDVWTSPILSIDGYKYYIILLTIIHAICDFIHSKQNLKFLISYLPSKLSWKTVSEQKLLRFTWWRISCSKAISCHARNLSPNKSSHS